MRKKLRFRVEFSLLRMGFFVFGILPERFAYRAVGSLGGILIKISRTRRQHALRLLHNAFPEEKDDRKLLRLASRGTGNLFKVVLDIARAGRLIERGQFLQRIDMTDLVSRELHSPWIGVTGHLGSWECGAIGVAEGVQEAHVTARLMKNPLAQEWLSSSRRRAGLFIHDRRGGIRGLANALGRGAIAMQVVDQNQRRRGVFAPFFGQMASTERAAASLAVRKGYPFVVAAGVRVGPGFRFKFVVQDILEPIITGNVSLDVQNLVERMNRSLEKLILRFPDQYLWIHDRYRTQPSS